MTAAARPNPSHLGAQALQRAYNARLNGGRVNGTTGTGDRKLSRSEKAAKKRAKELTPFNDIGKQAADADAEDELVKAWRKEHDIRTSGGCLDPWLDYATMPLPGYNSTLLCVVCT